jgi:hypothetical protein
MLCIIAGSLSCYSQRNQCIRVGGGAGLFSLNYNNDGINSKVKLGYSGKVGYSYYFRPHWGIGTGVAVSMCSTDGFLDGAKISFAGKIDDEGDEYRKDIYFRDWHERQRILFAEIPLLLHYQYDFGLRKRRKIYIDMGVKLQLPLLSNYEVTRGELEIQGYYAKWNVTLFGLPNHGFGTEKGQKSAGKLSLPMNIAATVAIGFSFEVSKKVDVYIGGIFDYGFINLKSVNEGDLLYEDKNGILQYRGILMSSAIEKANTISMQGEVGVRIALSTKRRSGIYNYRSK